MTTKIAAWIFFLILFVNLNNLTCNLDTIALE